MTDAKLPAEIIGHMAGLDATNEPLQACNSCQRAVIYGALGHLSTAHTYLQEGQIATAAGHVEYAIDVLLEIAKLDLTIAVPGVEDTSNDEWRVTLAAFIESRIDHYTDADTGSIVFEPHNEDGEPTGVAE
jgi:hypothetical protein